MPGTPKSENIDRIELPSAWLTMTEPLRAAFEALTLITEFPALHLAPRGDGHSVLVLPGFATADAMTQVLRNFLAYLGYASEPWRLGLNMSPAAVR